VLGYGGVNFNLAKNGRKVIEQRRYGSQKSLIKNCGAVGLSVPNPRITSKER
jgi:hypothetical protein